MMKPQWLAVAACVCLVASARSAAVPTQDTLVVARSDEGESSTAALSTEATTDEPAPPIKLTDMDVTSRVALRYAHTAVVTTVRNPARRAQEATFRVLLPETAFISGFVMTLDGKSYRAYVKEKEEAKQIYNQAVSQGFGAAHIATKARDSNQFTVSVNVEPNTVAVFNLTYEELLVRRNGVYNHAINLHPGALVPRLTVTVLIDEAQKINTLRVPEIRTGNEIDATEEDAQNSKAVIERSNNDRQAKVVFKPNIEEQQRLIEIYQEKTKETRTPSYSYGYDGAEEDNKKDAEGVLGQFVVQYDVERPKNGEILVNDGYFVHFFAPSDLPPLHKHVVFVLDTSGSMMDRKIVQLREAMQTILGELNQGDYFNIVEFSSSVKVYDLKEADKEPAPVQNYYSYPESSAPPTLVPAAQATPDNVARAKVLVRRLYASGGTNIYSALDVAVSLIKKGVSWKPELEANTSTTEKDSKISTSTDVKTSTSTEKVAKTSTTTEVNSEVTTTDSTPKGATEKKAPETNEVSKDSKNLEPIIIFLTDGDPTVGETDPTRIINHLTEKNSGYNKATIFSLAFGEDADRKFLRKLSLRNDGFMRHIYEAADAALQLRAFYRQVASPLLADVKFVYPKKQVKEASLTKHEYRRFYDGSEVVVAGRVDDEALELSPQVLGFCGVDDRGGRKRYEILPKAPVAAHKDKFLPLERLWAHLTVRQLLDERDAANQADDDDSKEDTAGKKALALALKYEFVTPLTSLVVVKPNASNEVDAESVHKQNNAIGFGAPGMAGLAALPPRFSMSSSLMSHRLPAFGAPMAAQGLALAHQFSAPAPVHSAGFSSSVDDFALEEAYEYSDIVDSASPLASLSTTPVPFTPTLLPEITTKSEVMTTENPLAAYGLQDYEWLRPLLSPAGDSITFNANATTVTLKLAKNEDISNTPPESCAAAAGGGAGACLPLTRCAATAHLTTHSYPEVHCALQQRYAGVCCQKKDVLT